MELMELSIPIHRDLVNNIVAKLPEDVKRLLMHFGSGLCVAGGFCRDAFIGEEPKDVDIFAVDANLLAEALLWFKTEAKEYQLEKQKTNSVNFVANMDDEQTGFREVPPVQFINRVFYPMHGELIKSFDWSVCQIAVYYIIDDGWKGICTKAFGEDIQSGTLHYTAPERDEDPGGSVLRMMRFTQRGWKPTEESIARCLGRFQSRVADEIPFVRGSEDDYTEAIKICFRHVGYSGKKGNKSASFPIGD